MIAAILVTSAVSAQTGPTTSTTYQRKLSDSLDGEAKAALTRATSLFEVANYDAARVEFEQAYTLSSDARVLYNVAVCDKELERYARAISTLERSLELGGDKLPRRYVNRVKETIRALAPFVTTMNVETSHAGAAILVDGERLGDAPLSRPIPVDVGEHIVRLDKPGFRGESVRIKARSGQPVTVRLTMEPIAQKQQIRVRTVGVSQSDRAEVLIDGIVVGEAPWTGEVDTGQRRISIRVPGYAERTRTVDVKKGSMPAVTISMVGTDRRGRLQIRTGHDDNTISLDGRVIARGAFNGRVSPGEHTLRVARQGAEPYSVDFVIRDRETRTMNVALEESGGVPTWVWIAGGAVLAGATTATIILTNRETQYDGQTPGTLPPRVVPASYNFR